MREVALRLELREPSVSLIERGLMKAPADFAERFERAVQEITRERLEGSLAGVS